MPLVEVNAQTTAAGGLSGVAAALERLPPGARITIMVHGYRFDPSRPERSPHRDILSDDPARATGRGLSWPRHLGVGEAGLGIAFGWRASGSLWRAWAEAARAGVALARLLDRLHAGGRQADIVAHSLGARVALAALARAREGSVGRVILIAPAEFRDAAARALATPAGSAAEIVSVTSRENRLFDALVEWLLAPHRPGARTAGRGLVATPQNWTDLRIGERATLGALDRLGYRLAPPLRTPCHWSGYLRPGVFPLYRAILSGDLPVATLRAALPQRPSRSRLVEALSALSVLPLPRKPSF